MEIIDTWAYGPTVDTACRLTIWQTRLCKLYLQHPFVSFFEHHVDFKHSYDDVDELFGQPNSVSMSAAECKNINVSLILRAWAFFMVVICRWSFPKNRCIFGILTWSLSPVASIVGSLFCKWCSTSFTRIFFYKKLPLRSSTLSSPKT